MFLATATQSLQAVLEGWWRCVTLRRLYLKRIKGLALCTPRVWWPERLESAFDCAACTGMEMIDSCQLGLGKIPERATPE